MNEKKYCPFFTMAASALQLDTPQSCMKKYCALWIERLGRCGLVASAIKDEKVSKVSKVRHNG